MDFSTILNDITKQDWGSLGYYLLTGGGLSVILQTLKHLAGTKWGHIFVVFLLGLFSTVTAVAYYYINNSSPGFVHFTIRDSAYLLTAATFVYHLAVNPIYVNKIKPALITLSEALAQVKANKPATPAATATPVDTTDEVLGS